jgi:hypothetical protein
VKSKSPTRPSKTRGWKSSSFNQVGSCLNGARIPLMGPTRSPTTPVPRWLREERGMGRPGRRNGLIYPQAVWLIQTVASRSQNHELSLLNGNKYCKAWHARPSLSR